MAGQRHATPAKRAHKVEKASTWAGSQLTRHMVVSVVSACPCCCVAELLLGAAANRCWTGCNQLHHAKVPDWLAAQSQFEGCTTWQQAVPPTSLCIQQNKNKPVAGSLVIWAVAHTEGVNLYILPRSSTDQRLRSQSTMNMNFRDIPLA
jgi:hypothetical protein